MSKAVEKLRLVMASQQVTEKTFSIKEGFKSTCKEARPYQTDKGLELPVVGIEVKFVPKYQSYHTLLHLEGGKTTGCFSDAVFKFSALIMAAMGIHELEDWARVDFDNPLIVQVVEKAFDHVDPVTLESTAHTTYELTIVGGETEKVRKIDSVANYVNLMGATDVYDQLDHLELPEGQAKELPEPEQEKKSGKKTSAKAAEE